MRPDTLLSLDGELSFRLPVGVKRERTPRAAAAAAIRICQNGIHRIGRFEAEAAAAAVDLTSGEKESALPLRAMRLAGGKDRPWPPTGGRTD